MVGIALLGAGLIARQAHVPALLENNANILAICSRSTKSALSLVDAIKDAGGSTSTIDVYSDEQSDQNLTTLLTRHDIHAVIIMLPILIQPDIVRQCLAAGKHVLCEKPIAKDIATGHALITDYETTYAPRNLIFSIAEQFRYDISYARARDIVASGEIGSLQHVHARVWNDIPLTANNKYFETAWRREPEYQGGFLLDGGVHYVALIRMIAGQEIVETRGVATQVYAHLPPADTVNAALRFKGGAVGSLSVSFASWKRAFEFVFVGTRGALTVMNASAGSRDTKLVMERVDEEPREEVIAGKGVYEEIKAFLRAAESGQRDPKGSPWEALADVAVVESLCSGGGQIESYV